MTSLGLARCKIGPTGAKEIAEYVSGTAVLKKIDLKYNSLGDAEQLVRDAVRDRSGFELLV